jgi:hypothetical protein
MSKNKSISFVLLLLAVFTFVGCKENVPSNYIQPGEMEDILYDYHLAQSMGATSDKQSAYSESMYRAAVFKKYGITEADFDSSMVYYMRHTDRLHDIYGNLSKRLSEEAERVGATTGGYDMITNEGDTANIWNNKSSVALTPIAPFNKVSFRIAADTTMHKGDSFILAFRTQFLYQDGMKDMTAVLAVRYDNDSIAQQVMHVSVSDLTQLKINGAGNLGIKEVYGFLFLAPPTESETITTMRLLLVYDIKLVRMHVLQKDIDEQARRAHEDSVNAANNANGGANQPAVTEGVQAAPRMAVPVNPAAAPQTPQQPVSSQPVRQGNVQRVR